MTYGEYLNVVLVLAGVGGIVAVLTVLVVPPRGKL
jgi:hypothetical protein